MLRLFQGPPDISLHRAPKKLDTALSMSDVFVDCAICKKKFENELDVLNHMERVHEYGESFRLYPCDQCGFRAGDKRELDQHICEHDSAQNTKLLLSDDLDAAPENTYDFN